MVCEWQETVNVVQVLFRVKQLFVAAQTVASCTVTTQTPARDDAAEPEDELVPVSVVLVHRKKWTWKSAHLVKGDEAGPSQKLEEEAEQKFLDPYPWGSCGIHEKVSAAIQLCALSPGCSNGASSLELGDREAKQLG